MLLRVFFASPKNTSSDGVGVVSLPRRNLQSTAGPYLYCMQRAHAYSIMICTV
jgi:hypothetical protein